MSDLSGSREPALAGPLGGCVILVVEDQYLQADHLRMVLRRAGAEVLGPFRDAARAVEAARRRAPTCALIDINLGDGPRFDAAEALLALGAPVVFVTGYSADMIPPSLAKVPRIEKPARPEHLVAAVARACAAAAEGG